MEQQESFHSENEFKTTNERLVKISDPNLHKTKMEKKHKKGKSKYPYLHKHTLIKVLCCSHYLFQVC